MLCPKCGKMNKEGSDYCMHCGAPLSAAEAGDGQRLKGDLAKKWSGGNGKGSEIYGVSAFHNGAGKGSAEHTSRLKGSLSKNTSGEGDFQKSDENSGGREVQYCKKCGRRIKAGEKYCSVCGKGMGGAPAYGGADRKLWIGIASALAAVLLIVGISFALGGNEEKGKPLGAIGTGSSLRTAAAADPQPQHTQYHTPAPTAKPAPKPVPTAVPTTKPAPTATPQYGPGPEDIRGHDSRLVEPEAGAWLGEYDVRYVQSTGGVSIYLRWGPSGDYEHFDTVKEAEPVTVLAEQNDFALVLASDSRLGWCKSALTVFDHGAPGRFIATGRIMENGKQLQPEVQRGYRHVH